MASMSTCHLGLWLGWQILLNLVKREPGVRFAPRDEIWKLCRTAPKTYLFVCRVIKVLQFYYYLDKRCAYVTMLTVSANNDNK